MEKLNVQTCTGLVQGVKKLTKNWELRIDKTLDCFFVTVDLQERRGGGTMRTITLLM